MLLQKWICLLWPVLLLEILVVGGNHVGVIVNAYLRVYVRALLQIIGSWTITYTCTTRRRTTIRYQLHPAYFTLASIKTPVCPRPGANVYTPLPPVDSANSATLGSSRTLDGKVFSPGARQRSLSSIISYINPSVELYRDCAYVSV
jgi:hypothetical protein